MRTRPGKKEETNSLFLSFSVCCALRLSFSLPWLKGKLCIRTQRASQHTDEKTSEKVRFSFLPDECCVYLGLGLSLSYFFQELSLLSVRIYVSNWNPGKMELAVTWQLGKKKLCIVCCIYSSHIYAVCVCQPYGWADGWVTSGVWIGLNYTGETRPKILELKASSSFLLFLLWN